MSFTAKILFDRTARIQARLRNETADALRDMGEAILSDASKTIPYDTGTMDRSGFVEVDESTLDMQIGYDVPYAAQQHEDTTIRHPNGRRAKWLELTVAENADRYRAMMEAAIRRGS